jgi:hypothetical protein
MNLRLVPKSIKRRPAKRLRLPAKLISAGNLTHSIQAKPTIIIAMPRKKTAILRVASKVQLHVLAVEMSILIGNR